MSSPEQNYFLHFAMRYPVQWSKVIQYAANSNEENRKPKYLQNFDKRLDMGKHPFILVITIYFIHFSLSIAVL